MAKGNAYVFVFLKLTNAKTTYCVFFTGESHTAVDRRRDFAVVLNMKKSTVFRLMTLLALFALAILVWFLALSI